MQSDATVVSMAAVFLEIAAIIIAMLGQKMLHWQLSKVFLFGMYHCNFEVINWVSNKKMKKLEIE